MNDQRFDQLINNLRRIDHAKSIFNIPIRGETILSLWHGDINEWLEKLLPDTRLIIEPKIDGSAVALQYFGGKLIKGITRKGTDKTEALSAIKNIPIKLPINRDIHIRGELYDPNLSQSIDMALANRDLKNKLITTDKALTFCAFQIINSDQNQFQALQELHRLGFEIPESEFTNFTSEVGVYAQLWREGKLFKKYPTDGIVFKVNSRKFQKQLGENSISSNWAFAVKY